MNYSVTVDYGDKQVTLPVELRRKGKSWLSRWREPGWERWWCTSNKRHRALNTIATRLSVSRDTVKITVRDSRGGIIWIVWA